MTERLTGSGELIPAWHRELQALVGLRLSRIGRAADMLMMHFGAMRPHPSGRGAVGQYALHVQCHWRLDEPRGTITGQTDLRLFAGPGQEPEGWDFECGSTLQDAKLSEIFGERQATLGWNNDADRFVVSCVTATAYGDVQIDFSSGYALRLFPDSALAEAWRFFAPGAELHLVYRSEAALE